MKRLVIGCAAVAALFVVSGVSADKGVTPGADNAFPACIANCAYPTKYLALAPAPPALPVPPVGPLAPNTCGPVATAAGTFQFCARGDGSLILIW